MSAHQNKIGMIIFCALIFLLPIGCAYKNRAVITNLSELNGNLYVALSNKKFLTYDVKNKRFRDIKGLEGHEITKLIRTSKSLIVEATSYGENNQFGTTEHIYIVNAKGQIAKLISVRSGGRKQYISSLMAADDNYVYVLKNKIDKDYHFSLNKYRYDISNGNKIEAHFDDEQNLVVQDIYEDIGYFWYACYNNPSARHWTSLTGYGVLVRRNKKTNELKKIILKNNNPFTQPLLISGDKNNIWFFEMGRSKLFRFNKKSFSYETKTIKDFRFTAKEIPLTNYQDHLWLILKGWMEPLTLHRVSKSSLNSNPIEIDVGKIKGYHSTIMDNHSVWIGLSEFDPAPPGSANNRVPYLLRLSRNTLQAEVIPFETSFGEGITNMAKSFFGSIWKFIYALFGGPG